MHEHIDEQIFRLAVVSYWRKFVLLLLFIFGFLLNLSMETGTTAKRKICFPFSFRSHLLWPTGMLFCV
jgi:hypothetical protein